MKTSQLVGSGIAVVLVAIVAFLGGIHYTQSSAGGTSQTGNYQFSGRAGTSARGLGSGTAGTIVSVSPTNLTIQTPNGSSQIVFFSSSTPVMKIVSGSASDLSAGISVVIAGSPNADGSLTAQGIEIRPAGMFLRARTGTSQN